jgi:very-short-patch-repair endonuclease
MPRERSQSPSHETIDRARKLRKDASFPERLLWSRLRGGRLCGLKFRRQHPVGPFVADFFCHDAMLVVELDGMSHVGQADYDERRSEFLRQEGLRVLRVSNDDVLKDMESVLVGILRECGVGLEAG